LVTVEWQKYYDEAVAGEKSGNPAAAGVVLLGGGAGGTGGAAFAGGAGQGWNTVTGGKGVIKSSNPWGNQNRTVPPSPSNAESPYRILPVPIYFPSSPGCS